MLFQKTGFVRNFRIASYPGSGRIMSDKCMQTMDPLPLTVSE
jgi:hypothetical protein